ncbi:uncharacterized protein F4822DRAFT_366897 [Hypoxylon trugodes]|uniref:uncharacterized protein n=1 Tax=Hypoxylon trugodes TaxID=326681 RepID=UPI00218DFFB9|nr:uncharacterized protein F4822DRAFT_366897 [Hypoxylon trugodes]KAI1384562.1 hypothetical protein F4822DRAFT_366897 [Hypoxylon trugodes]
MPQSGLGGATQASAYESPEFSDMQVGDVSEEGLQFCPWKLIRVYPHQYVGRGRQGEVGSFFKATMFEGRSWDFFFLLDPGANGRDPLLLVPSTQFEEYLDEANVQLGARLSIPKGGAGADFFVTFDTLNAPRPRYLGRIGSEGAVEALKIRIAKLPKDDLTQLDSASLRRYRDKMNWIYGTFKSSKNKKDPEVARIKRVDRQKGYGRMVKRAQRYLGLRDRTAYRSNPGTLALNWNVNMEVPFKTNSLRFICVDVEAWETANDVITEVGLAILDTEDTMKIPPGEDGRNWFPLIKSRHFRIREHVNKVNYKFIHGCPHLFDFGESEFVSAQDTAKKVGSIIGDNESQDKRPVVMVGHDIAQDLKYLLKIGYNLWCVPQILDEMDTKSMFQRWEGSPDGRGLAHVCEELGIPGRNFHNAGNDATYTLRAMIVMAVRQIFGNSAKVMEKMAEKTTEKVQEKPGEKTAREFNYSEWSDGEMDDGGLPQKTPEPTPQPGYIASK